MPIIICRFLTAVLLFSMLLGQAFLPLPGVQRAYAQATAPAPGQPIISFKGGPGDTLETAVVITGAPNSIAGIAAETKYLEKKFGRQNRDWRSARKNTLQQDDNYYDRLVIVLKDGSKKTIFFDITAFFGKL